MLSSPKSLFEIGKCESIKAADRKTCRRGVRTLARMVPKQQVAVSKLDKQDMRGGGAAELGGRKGIRGCPKENRVFSSFSFNSVPFYHLSPSETTGAQRRDDEASQGHSQE